MTRFVIVIAVTALAGVVLATWGGAASARESGPSVAATTATIATPTVTNRILFIRPLLRL